jgi:hypothetical protein
MNLFRKLREKTVWRDVAPAILVLSNSFVWYIFAYTLFSQIINGLPADDAAKTGLFSIYYAVVAVTAILGYKFFSRSRGLRLSIWLFMGSVSTILFVAIPSNNMIVNSLLSLFFGASVGIGLPSCLSYFADATSVENRGVVGGISWSIVGLSVIVFAFLYITIGTTEAIIALTAWRLIGASGFLAFTRKQSETLPRKSPSFSEVFHRKGLLLYWVPWIMFALINFAEAPIVETFFGASMFATVQIMEWVLIGIFAIIGGIIADVAGRKRVVIAGFVMLGVEYAAMSAISPELATTFAPYLYLALDGITWGLLFSVFFTALWGDLAENHTKEKYYIIGGLPYLLANFLYIVIKPFASIIFYTAAFTFASFFLFISVIPLMYAPETLPEKVMKDRDLRSYAEKALKQVQKDLAKDNKDHKKQEQENAEEAPKEPKESSEDEEARKLAEKYY